MCSHSPFILVFKLSQTGHKNVMVEHMRCRHPDQEYQRVFSNMGVCVISYIGAFSVTHNI